MSMVLTLPPSGVRSGDRDAINVSATRDKKFCSYCVSVLSAVHIIGILYIMCNDLMLWGVHRKKNSEGLKQLLTNREVLG